MLAFSASIFLLLLSMSYDRMEEKFYYAFEEKIALKEVENKVVVSFEPQKSSNIQKVLQQNAKITHMELLDNYNRYILTIEKSSAKTLTKELRGLEGIKSVKSVYATSEGSEHCITDEILVQFKEDVSKDEIDRINKKFNVVVKEINKVFHVLSVPPGIDALEIANAYQTSGLVNFSHPDFLRRVTLSQSVSDPYFINQYYLRNTGQTVNGRSCTSGADINVVNAWNITKGSSNITIAVIDGGVSDAHPDLPSTRQVRLPNSNFGNELLPNNPSPSADMNHGNGCAGIIAASHNNEGIAGIAPNCKIMPIRIMNFDDSFVSDQITSNAIRFAVAMVRYKNS